MDPAYRWFLGILGAIFAAFLAVFALVRLGVIGFTLQLCDKRGDCTTYGPTGYVEQLVVVFGLTAAAALVAVLIAVIFVRRRGLDPRGATEAGDHSQAAVPPKRTDTRLPEGRSPGA